MGNVVRITDENGSITLQGMLGDVKTVSGKIIDVNMTKQQAIIDI